MSDEPSVTRWSFQDFKLFYDAKFGRKREALPPQEKPKVENGNGSYSAVTNGDARVQNTSDLAIYEQYRNQGANGVANRNGELSNGTAETPQRSLIPPFESAEMRTLAESLSR